MLNLITPFPKKAERDNSTPMLSTVHQNLSRAMNPNSCVTKVAHALLNITFTILHTWNLPDFREAIRKMAESAISIYLRKCQNSTESS